MFKRWRSSGPISVLPLIVFLLSNLIVLEIQAQTTGTIYGGAPTRAAQP